MFDKTRSVLKIMPETLDSYRKIMHRAANVGLHNQDPSETISGHVEVHPYQETLPPSVEAKS
ncbi:hypothetical protein [Pseudorhodoplanes sp.]|uniref:hypothetical protein n=1 Tax=Pseudorhodoplanes sp. TaxID=1934341 RepID=UPI003D0CE436